MSWRMVTRNLDKPNVLTADKDYDWWLLRRILCSEGAKPEIKHREFGLHGIANNLSQDETVYHHRSRAEPTSFVLRRKYGEIVHARTGVFRLYCGTYEIAEQG